ncbi:hypothetical protein APA_4699 [Pseudanabaena sp. lw0831]|nr:hypothetical protein APA_4699 [Pseudanabaena sp. lw0831]
MITNASSLTLSHLRQTFGLSLNSSDRNISSSGKRLQFFIFLLASKVYRGQV